MYPVSYFHWEFGSNCKLTVTERKPFPVASGGYGFKRKLALWRVLSLSLSFCGIIWQCITHSLSFALFKKKFNGMWYVYGTTLCLEKRWIIGVYLWVAGGGSRLGWVEEWIAGFEKVGTVIVNTVTLAWRKAGRWDGRWQVVSIRRVFPVSREHTFVSLWGWSARKAKMKR